MRKTIKQLERELEYAKKFEDMYRDQKKKYDDKFESRYDNLMQDNKQLWNNNDKFIDIVRWLINPESTVPMILKE